MYIEANEGGSSGGHAAIRFGEQAFHFQLTDGGRLEITREPWLDFVPRYAQLHNRTMHVSRIAVSDDTWSGLRQRFNRRYLTQLAQLEVESALEADRELLLALVRDGARHPLQIPAAGYFVDDAGNLATTASPALEALRRRLEAALPGAIAQRRARERGSLEALGAEAFPAGASTIAMPRMGMVPSRDVSFAERLRNHAAALAALAVLERTAGLRSGAWISGSDPAFDLEPSESVRLRALARSLDDALVRLFDSDRPDWASPFLVAMARRVAVERSLETGRFVFLDALPETPLLARGESGALTALLEQEFRVRFEAALDGLLEDPRVRRLAWLEEKANDWVELERAKAERRPRRVSRVRLVPALSGPPPALAGPLPLPASGALRRAIASNDAARRTWLRGLRSLYGYDLVTRNCVSELFAVIDEALLDLGKGAPVELESKRRLGGHVDPARSLAFIPFVSSRAVRERYRVVDTFEVRSHRRARLDDMYEAEPDVAVYLRESNTLTSSIYRRNAGDSFFLFFTDDTLLLRPLYGALNLVAAIGESTVGLLRAPFDRGRVLKRGLRGALVSLPELFFWNIRKGSNEFVPPGLALEEPASRLGGRPKMGRLPSQTEPNGLRQLAVNEHVSP